MSVLGWCKAWATVLVLAVGVSAQTIDWNAPNITITTEAQLRELANRVNGTGFVASTFLGQTITLGANITLTSTWTPIGNNSRQFRGTFDGGERSISNLSLSLSVSETLYAGLFGYVGRDGQIKNLAVNVTEIVATSTSSTFAGGLAGFYASIKAIENCKVNISNRVHASGSSGAFSGGLVGLSSVEDYYEEEVTLAIINSYTTGNVSGSHFSGGLVGQKLGAFNVASTIINSYTAGNISAPIAGGLVGEYRGETLIISNSYTTVNVSASSTGVGLVGSEREEVF